LLINQNRMSANLVLLENESQFNLFPFTLNRSAADIRIGILTIREKWERISGSAVTILKQNEINSNDVSSSIPANLIPDTSATTSRDIFHSNHRRLQHPWQLVEYNDWAIRQDFSLLTENRVSQQVPETVTITNPDQVFIEEGAKLEHCYINASQGPVYIGKNALVMDGAMLRGPVSIGENAVVKMGTSIYGASTIGPYCIVGGEIKNSILFSYSNKAHHGYLGDAVIGEWCNLGAGTSCSNLKNTGGKIKVWDMHRNAFKTAGNKCGLLMGDYCKSAINTSFNSGTVTGICANIFDSAALTPKFIASFSWGIHTGQQYLLEKAITEIETWMKFKNCSLQEDQKMIVEKLYKAL
jgi:UDP-N-acetylglucosamine diphosphorylase / glucose-1-phosphate thymidylyltransferase / UDP-N-acetylgalactosamine diphosphorylase / glucosamine-1-phosphate N-acetyltransferase / galactosamine-1-phosphate N-acetyltransferase